MDSAPLSGFPFVGKFPASGKTKYREGEIILGAPAPREWPASALSRLWPVIRATISGRATGGPGIFPISGKAGFTAPGCRPGPSPTLIDFRPACKQGSFMDPIRLPHALCRLAPDSQTASYSHRLKVRVLIR